MVLLASCQPTLVNIQMVLLDLDATSHYTGYFSCVQDPTSYTIGSKCQQPQSFGESISGIHLANHTLLKKCAELSDIYLGLLMSTTFHKANRIRDMQGATDYKLNIHEMKTGHNCGHLNVILHETF